MQRRHRRLGSRRPVRDHRAVPVKRWITRRSPRARIPHRSLIRRRLCQLARKSPPAFHIRLAPHQALHRHLLGHPRPARLAPARAAKDRHLQIKLLRQLRRVLHRVVPLFGPEVDLRFHHLPIARRHIHQLESANPHPLHPLQVLGNARLGHVAIGPVPPRPRLCRIRRHHKSLRQRVLCIDRYRRTLGNGRGGGSQCGRSHDRRQNSFRRACHEFSDCGSLRESG